MFRSGSMLLTNMGRPRATPSPFRWPMVYLPMPPLPREAMETLTPVTARIRYSQGMAEGEAILLGDGKLRVWGLAGVPLQEGGIVPVRHEADVLAVPLFGHRQAALAIAGDVRFTSLPREAMETLTPVTARIRYSQGMALFL